MPTTDSSSKILLCDDSGLNVACISTLLEAGGYGRIRTITDPRQLMPLLDQEGFDLLLLDLDMPHFDSIELTRQIRRRYSAAELPILAITASAANETRNLALGCGANDYLNKPIDGIELSLRVRNLLAIRGIHQTHLEIRGHLESEVAARTAKLDMLIENGLMLSIERDRSKLLRHILVEGQRLLHCDGATVYLVTEAKTLRFALRTRDDALPSDEIPLYDAATGKPNEKYVSTWVALNQKSALIEDVYREQRFDLSGTRLFDEKSHYRAYSTPNWTPIPRESGQ